ncbi:MAG TPA: radical SAM protein [Candidatus Omnitrophota bacterium]|nr:radical SAM protein [Candidatus Omnitrophota bacterium]
MLKFNYIYGPVQSWRMGKSLGIDPICSDHKICNLNCLYCQLGRTRDYTNERGLFTPTDKILEEIKRFFTEVSSVDQEITRGIDYLTLSGRGEPTLAKNLGEIIRGIKQLRKERVAVITNATLMGLPEVREELALADYVSAKLDASSEFVFLKVNRPIIGTTFGQTIEGIKKFSRQFSGKLVLQIMFVETNQPDASGIAKLVREIPADEIQINTPLRPSATPALDKENIKKIKNCFAGLPVVSVYDGEQKPSSPLDAQDTMRRHGCFVATDRAH